MNKKRILKLYEIFLLYIFLLIILVFLGSHLQHKFGIAGIFFTEIIFILFPVFAIIKFFKLDAHSLLPFKPFKYKEIFNNIGKWSFSLIVIGLIGQIQLKYFPEQMRELDILNKLFKETHLWEQVFIFSLTPAICEEVLFRGLIFGSFKKNIDIRLAILLSGLLFGIFHIYPGKILTTALLGMFFAYAAHRANSLLMSIILHFINNLYVFLLLSNADKLKSNYNISVFLGITILSLACFGAYQFYKDFQEN